MYTSIDKMKERPELAQWDAATILTTYTNTENHPSIIRAPRKGKINKIKLSKKGIPLGVLGDGAGRKAGEEEEDDEEEWEEPVNVGKARPKKETREEKAARKRAVKQARREARQAKKAMKMAFKKESNKQQATAITQNVQNFAHVKL